MPMGLSAWRSCGPDMIARDVLDGANAQTGADAKLAIQYGGHTEGWHILYVDTTAELSLDRLRTWLESRDSILERHGLRVTIDAVRSWDRPTDPEMQQAAFTSETDIPLEKYGSSLHELAMDRFRAGDIEGALKQFEWMSLRRPDNWFRNNVAYCSILLGRHSTAHALFEQMDFGAADRDWPIWQHNKAVATFLVGDKTKAQAMFRETWEWLRNPATDFDPRGVICMLLLGKEGPMSVDGLPIDAAVLLNACFAEAIPADDALPQVRNRYPEESTAWLARIEESAQ